MGFNKNFRILTFQAEREKIWQSKLLEKLEKN